MPKHDPDATGRYLDDVRADLQRMRSTPQPSPVPAGLAAASPTPVSLPLAQTLAELVFARIGHDPVALRQFEAALTSLTGRIPSAPGKDD